MNHRILVAIVLLFAGVALAQIMPNGHKDTSLTPPMRPQLATPDQYTYLAAKIGNREGIYRVDRTSGVVGYFDGRQWLVFAGQIDPRTGGEAR